MSKDEILILGDDDCPPCEELHQALKREEGEGKVRFVGLNSLEGRQLVEQEDAPEIPSAFTRQGQGWAKCDIFKDGDTIVLSCGDKVIPLKDEESVEPQP